MTGTKQRNDRARRRAVRALAAQLGVAYSVAARLLAEGRREAPFAEREQRPFHARVRDTRESADLPLGRAARLTARFPRRASSATAPHHVAVTGASTGTGTGTGTGQHRETVLAMLYAVVLAESPSLVPDADELAWVAELGEEAAVDITCVALDRAARLLLDDDTWHLWTRVEAALTAGVTSPDRHLRDAAVALDRELRTVSLRGSLPAARRILDALLADAYSATRS